MKVAGVDPSIASTGVGWITAYRVQTARIRSKAVGQSLDDQLDRLTSQAANVVEIVGNLMPDLIVIEGPSHNSTSSSAHMVAGYWWLLVRGLRDWAPVAVVPPATLKKFTTSNGRADKADMVAAVLEGFDLDVKDDEADALALAVMGAEHLGMFYVGGFPSMFRGSLAKAQWPSKREMDR